ncbi:MAG TPA: SurA N-terminal domain-containing protein [Azospira sp.]|nr:SurA N-terminal domain-containing protein [Azospira sp.]
MFDAVRNNKRIVQVFLGLITLPFAFWGVESYIRNAGTSRDVATVGGSSITQQQYQQAWRNQQERLRSSLGPNYNPALMESPEARLAVVNSLVDQRVLLLEASKRRLMASDDLLRDVISKIPALQEVGKFSPSRYEAALKAQGLTQTGFEAQLRQDLTLQQLVGAVSETGMVAAAAAEAMLRIQAEERQVAELRIVPEQFAAQAKPSLESLQKFYDDNKASFEIPEQVRAEYVQLSLDALLAQLTVSAEEVKSWYEGHKERYQQSEERRASHILIPAGNDVAQAKAKAKAEAVLKEVQQNPGKFADIAKRESQDPGSASKGGDLGFFGKGMMVKPFEEAVFSQKEGELSGLVQSDFGFHIIKVTGIKGGKLKSLEEVKGEIETELKRQAASRKFAEAAETFSNLAYEQSDSLKPVAERFKLPLQQTAWFSRRGGQNAGVVGNEKLLGALFGEDALKNKRNTEAVEVGPNTLVAARVLEHKPASLKPFESVKGQIEDILKIQQTNALAKQAGEEKLAQLKSSGEDKLAWALVKNVSRMEGSRQVPSAALQAIFKADASKLPAYTGVEFPNNGGYALYKIMKVSQPSSLDEGKRKVLQKEYTTLVAQEDFAAYLAGLRARYKVEINKAALEDNKDR